MPIGLAAFGLGPPLSLGFYAVGAATASWPGLSRFTAFARLARASSTLSPTTTKQAGMFCLGLFVGAENSPKVSAVIPVPHCPYGMVL
jgi:hypothetical protein